MSKLILPEPSKAITCIHQCDNCRMFIDIHAPCSSPDQRELCDYCLDDEYEGSPDITPQSCGIEL